MLLSNNSLLKKRKKKLKKKKKERKHIKNKKKIKVTYLAFACVNICDFKFVDCANFLLHPSNGQT